MHIDNYNTTNSENGAISLSPIEKIKSKEQQMHNILRAIALLPQHLGCIEEYVGTAMALQTAFGVKWIRQAMQRSRHIKTKALRDPIILSILEGNPPKLSFEAFAHAATVIREPFAVEFQPFVSESGTNPVRVTPSDDYDFNELIVDGLSCLKIRFQSDGFVVTSDYWPQCDLANALDFDRQVFKIASILGHRCVLVLSSMISA